MKKLKQLTLGLSTAALITPLAHAADFSVQIQNLTRSVYFTPLIVAAHPEGSALFELGEAASTEVRALAEGGDTSGVETMLAGLGATQANHPVAGLLGPGDSATADLNTDGTSNNLLSIMGMILPTNDGIVAVNGLEIPTEAGTYTYYAKAYDAGTEANDEIVGSGMPGEAGFPAPGPLATEVGSGGTGVTTAVAEGFVHIHRGVLGDTDATGGMSDIDSTRHRWLNPIAKITITVN